MLDQNYLDKHNVQCCKYTIQNYSATEYHKKLIGGSRINANVCVKGLTISCGTT